MTALPARKKQGASGGEMKKRRGRLLIFPGLQTSGGRRLVGVQARAVMNEPGLQHCPERTDAFTWWRLTRSFHSSGAHSRATAGQG